MATAPETVSSNALFWGIPTVEAFPADLHGRAVFIPLAVYAGDPVEGERLMQPLRELATPLLDLSGTMPYATLQSAFDAFFPQGWLYYWKSLSMDRLDDEAIAAIIGYAEARPSPHALMALWHLEGGAAGRVPAEATAYGSRQMPYLLSFDTTWTEDAASECNIAWTRAAWADMRRLGPGGLYLNFAGLGEEKEDLVRAAYGANYDRLVELKSRYDPGNLFRMNQNIKPA
jgi:FAD/FMN-containing dehydrogenase